MSQLYGEYDSIAGGGLARLVPERVRRLLGAALFLGLVAAMALWAYRLGTRDAAEVPIIRAMEGPARVQPEEPGGLQAPHQGLEVNAVLAGEPAPPPQLTLPVAPAPTLLAEEDGPQGELAAPAAPLVEAEPAPGGELRAPLPDEGPALAEPAAPAPAEPAPVVTQTTIAALVEAVVEPQDEPAAADGARPLRRPANLVRASAQPAPAAASLSEGERLVQLGAFDSEPAARDAWSRLVGANGDLLGDKSLHIERATANARVFYRLRAGGFGGADETGAMCEALRARGVDCIPVTLQ